MKRFLVFALCFFQMAGAFFLPCQAQEKAYHWYCVHERGHIQPSADKELLFVEELDGYYVDHSHSEITEAEKIIYLTFDAGYENGNVAKVLDILKEEQVTGAFFILGHLITHDTDLVKRMATEGHTVCNHTVRHKDMSGLDDGAFIEELQALETLYKEQTGFDMAPYYRPPQGVFSRQNLVCAQANGYRTIFWSFAYPDWDNQKQMSPQKAKSMIMDNIHNGEVMLLHPTSATNAAILRDVIRELKEQGYQFGTLDQLTQRETSLWLP